MSDVKWIKITTDIFDDEKILLIESLPNSYAIITVWFKLLCLAGKQNNGGVFLVGSTPYTESMLATIFRMKKSTVEAAIKTFEEYRMVERIDGVITIPNWNKHQTLDSYEKKKERDRIYQSERRLNQRALIKKSSDSKTIKSSDVAISEKEEDKEEDKYTTAVAVVTRTGARKKATTAAKDESSRLKLIGGTIGKGVVYLSDGQIEKLLETMGSVEVFNRYVGRLADYIIEKNAHINSHYNTILKWYEEDSSA